MLYDPRTFQKCLNPLEISVQDKQTGKRFLESTSQNADRLPVTVYNNPLQGFKCENSAQTVDPEENVALAKCSDVRVRYYCNPGLVEMKGRIYTQVHGRSEAADFFANRLMEYPKVISSIDGLRGECSNHLNDGTIESCGSQNCGRNKKLQFKKLSGNDGVIQFVSRMSIPGAYNYTFQTFHNGNAVPNKRLLSFMNSDKFYPNNYEIFPNIISVTPQAGSTGGGTLLTIRGSGFVEDGLGGQVVVTVAGEPCKIVTIKLGCME